MSVYNTFGEEDQEKFQKMLEDGIPGIFAGDIGYRNAVHTPAGLMLLHLHCAGQNSHIACRFMEHRKALELVSKIEDRNPDRFCGLTGKWNWHDYEFNPTGQWRMTAEERRTTTLALITEVSGVIRKLQSL